MIRSLIKFETEVLSILYFTWVGVMATYISISYMLITDLL